MISIRALFFNWIFNGFASAMEAHQADQHTKKEAPPMRHFRRKELCARAGITPIKFNSLRAIGNLPWDVAKRNGWQEYTSEQAWRLSIMARLMTGRLFTARTACEIARQQNPVGVDFDDLSKPVIIDLGNGALVILKLNASDKSVDVPGNTAEAIDQVLARRNIKKTTPISTAATT